MRRSQENIVKNIAIIISTFTLFLVGACAKPQGAITIINNEETKISGNIDEQNFALNKDKFKTFNKVPIGEYSVIFTDGKNLQITVEENRTTVVDRAGQGCYAVVDYAVQYGDNPSSDVRVLEKIEKKSIFTPAASLEIPYGGKLPKHIQEGSSAHRLHSINCEMINNQERISQALSRLP